MADLSTDVSVDPDAAPCAASPDDLRAVPLFAELGDAQLAQLAETVRKRRAPAGRTLCREGERGVEMYVILRGIVTLHKLADGTDTELGRLESGAYFGEMALIGDAPRSATIRAATDVDYLAIDRDILMRAIAAVPTVALQILKGYNARLAETTERLAHLTARQRTPQPTRSVDSDDAYERALRHTILHGPHPLAVLARRLQVETAWDRKVARALDVFELIVKYTVCLLLADYLHSESRRSPELDRAVVAAFRRPTLGLLTDLSAKLLRVGGERGRELFVPELYELYYGPDGARTPCGRALQALTAYRNRAKHGAEGGRDDETFRHDFEGDASRTGGEPTDGIKGQIASILDAVGFLQEYPLIQITSMTYEHGLFQYAFDRVTGAYASLDRGTFSYDQPLENRRLYVLSRRDERALKVSPPLRRVRCPTCATTAVFLLFNWSVDRERGAQKGAVVGAELMPLPASRKERLEYLSYTCGHTLVLHVSAEQGKHGEGLALLLAGGEAAS